MHLTIVLYARYTNHYWHNGIRCICTIYIKHISELWFLRYYKTDHSYQPTSRDISCDALKRLFYFKPQIVFQNIKLRIKTLCIKVDIKVAF